MSPQHPLRRALTSLLALATFALAAAGMVLRTDVAGLALLAGAALCATCAWYALGAPVRRRDIGQSAGMTAERTPDVRPSEPKFTR